MSSSDASPPLTARLHWLATTVALAGALVCCLILLGESDRFRSGCLGVGVSGPARNKPSVQANITGAEFLKLI